MIREFKGKEIQNLVTKFFCRENYLCYQILIDIGNEELVFYREFENYTDYKKVYNHLKGQKKGNYSKINSAGSRKKILAEIS